MNQLKINDLDDLETSENDIDRVVIIAATCVRQARQQLADLIKQTDWEIDEDTREAAIEPPLSLVTDTKSGDAVRGVPLKDGTHEAADKIRKHAHELPVELVLTWRIEDLAPTPQDIRHTVETVIDTGAEIHAMGHEPPLGIREDSDALATIRALSDVADRNATPRIAPGPPTEGGRAGLGYEFENGHRHKTDNHQHVRAVLQAVKEGKSKRSAAKELGTSRSTITRCIEDRPQQYGLK